MKSYLTYSWHGSEASDWGRPGMTTGGSRGPAHTAPRGSGDTQTPGGRPGHKHPARTGLGKEHYLTSTPHMSPESWDLVNVNTTWRQIQNNGTMLIS